MNSSPSIVELSKALVKAQSKMGAAVKGSANPYFKSKYSDLNSVIEACKEHLNNEGISVVQPVTSDENGDFVETVLIHTSGEFISSKMKLRTQKENDMQAYGSSISYARRYGLQSMVFIPSSDDDDGEGAVGRSKATQKAVDKPKQGSTPQTTPEVKDTLKGAINGDIHQQSVDSYNLNRIAAMAQQVPLSGQETLPTTPRPTFRKSSPNKLDL